ncbi:hypothetical protein RRG08_039260 [Elysia crispata]|uniref:Uncharacterized protein n=1 Tax=Elysia crispata TaxID=231223 RepID=A0AAE0ZVD0_9GAST|nr:hypothetical protein RRG08_039260 [Elysia crispata]
MGFPGQTRDVAYCYTVVDSSNSRDVSLVRICSSTHLLDLTFKGELPDTPRLAPDTPPAVRMLAGRAHNTRLTSRCAECRNSARSA